MLKVIFFLLFILNSFAGETQFSLERLGLTFNEKDFTKNEVQELYEKRESRLSMHKHMGYLTIGLMTATVVAAMAGASKVNSRNHPGGYYTAQDAEDMKLHVGLAMVTALSHLATGIFAMSAPKPDNFVYEKSRTWHKNLAYFHYPAMILGPILGLMLYKKMENGEKRGGFERMHRPLMYTSYGASLIAASLMTFDFD